MRPTSRHLLVLIALAVVAALVVLLLFRPQVAAPTAESESSPVEPIRNEIPPVDPIPWAAVDWQPQEEPFAANQPPPIRMDGNVDGGDLILGWGRAGCPSSAEELRHADHPAEDDSGEATADQRHA